MHSSQFSGQSPAGGTVAFTYTLPDNTAVQFAAYATADAGTGLAAGFVNSATFSRDGGGPAVLMGQSSIAGDSTLTGGGSVVASAVGNTAVFTCTGDTGAPTNWVLELQHNQVAAP
jgi:hypothetical protein